MNATYILFYDLSIDICIIKLFWWWNHDCFQCTVFKSNRKWQFFLNWNWKILIVVLIMLTVACFSISFTENNKHHRGWLNKRVFPKVSLKSYAYTNKKNPYWKYYVKHWMKNLVSALQKPFANFAET